MFLDSKPVAVLIHGCHLQADLDGRSWQKLIWGSDNPDEPTMGGRVVMGLYIALHRKARLVTFSTGASEKDGLKEAEYTYQFVLAHLEPLARLLATTLNDVLTPDELGDWLRRRVFLDVMSQNTAEETASNLALALERKCKEVVSVSNAFHAPRCLAGLQAARLAYNSPLLVSAAPAFDEDYGTVILEPPHRGDQPKTNWFKLARRFFRIPEARRVEFEQKFSALCDEFIT